MYRGYPPFVEPFAATKWNTFYSSWIGPACHKTRDAICESQTQRHQRQYYFTSRPSIYTAKCHQKWSDNEGSGGWYWKIRDVGTWREFGCKSTRNEVHLGGVARCSQKCSSHSMKECQAAISAAQTRFKAMPIFKKAAWVTWFSQLILTLNIPSDPTMEFYRVTIIYTSIFLFLIFFCLLSSATTRCNPLCMACLALPQINTASTETRITLINGNGPSFSAALAMVSFRSFPWYSFLIVFSATCLWNINPSRSHVYQRW